MEEQGLLSICDWFSIYLQLPSYPDNLMTRIAQNTEHTMKRRCGRHCNTDDSVGGNDGVTDCWRDVEEKRVVAGSWSAVRKR
jgi:hypothetical protein